MSTDNKRDLLRILGIKTPQVFVMTSFMFLLQKDFEVDITMCYKELNCLLDICNCCKNQKKQ